MGYVFIDVKQLFYQFLRCFLIKYLWFDKKSRRILEFSEKLWCVKRLGFCQWRDPKWTNEIVKIKKTKWPTKQVPFILKKWYYDEVFVSWCRNNSWPLIDTKRTLFPQFPQSAYFLGYPISTTVVEISYIAIPIMPKKRGGLNEVRM